MDKFRRLKITNWRQFTTVDLNFDHSFTVLTGRNGCGKTTILNLLGKHFGWNIKFISTPHVSEKRKRQLWTDLIARYEQETQITPGSTRIGSLEYSSGNVCELFIPNESASAEFDVKYSNQQSVFGLNIPSHRSVTSYQPIANIPTNPKTNQQQFEEYRQLLLQTYGSGNHRNPGMVLKQSLISLGVFGYGNRAVAGNPDYVRMYEGFEQVLRNILPAEIGFEKLEIRMPDIVFVTRTGLFNLEAMSGGISALFSMAWQIFMYTVDQPHSTILIDEPENHLHPSMQREFLPALRAAFPSVTFIVATHSPFILTSFAEARVYALKQMADRIISEELESADLMGSTNKILREILGIPNTYPVWAEQRIAGILKEYLTEDYTEADVQRAYKALKTSGLGDLL